MALKNTNRVNLADGSGGGHSSTAVKKRDTQSTVTRMPTAEELDAKKAERSARMPTAEELDAQRAQSKTQSVRWPTTDELDAKRRRAERATSTSSASAEAPSPQGEGLSEKPARAGMTVEQQAAQAQDIFGGGAKKPAVTKSREELKSELEAAKSAENEAYKAMNEAVQLGDATAEIAAYDEAKAKAKAADKAYEDYLDEHRLTRKERDEADATIKELYPKVNQGTATADEAARFNAAVEAVQGDSDTKLGRAVDSTAGRIMNYGGSGLNAIATGIDLFKVMGMDESDDDPFMAKARSEYESLQAKADNLKAAADAEVVETGDRYGPAYTAYNEAKKAADAKLDELRTLQTEKVQGESNWLRGTSDSLIEGGQKLMGFAQDNATEEEKLIQEVAGGAVEMWLDSLGASGLKAGLSEFKNVPKLAIKFAEFLPSLRLSLRSFGGSAAEAKDAGANIFEQAAYAGASTLLEFGTEKISGVANSIYGKGASDDIVKAFIDKISIDDTSKFLFTATAAVVSEGNEEGVSEVLNPFLKGIYDNGEARDYYFTTPEGRKELAGNVWNAELVGGLLGGLGNVAETGINRVQAWAQTKQGKAVIAAAKEAGISEQEVIDRLTEAVDSVAAQEADTSSVSQSETPSPQGEGKAETAADIANEIMNGKPAESAVTDEPLKPLPNKDKVSEADAVEAKPVEGVKAEDTSSVSEETSSPQGEDMGAQSEARETVDTSSAAEAAASPQGEANESRTGEADVQTEGETEAPSNIYEGELTAAETRVSNDLTLMESATDAEIDDMLDNKAWRSAFENRMGVKLEGSPREQRTAVRQAAVDFMENGGFPAADIAEGIRYDNDYAARQQERTVDRESERVLKSYDREMSDMSRQADKDIKRIETLSARIEKAKANAEVKKIKDVVKGLEKGAFHPDKATWLPAGVREAVSDVIDFFNTESRDEAAARATELIGKAQDVQRKAEAELTAKRAELEKLYARDGEEVYSRRAAGDFTVAERITELRGQIDDLIRETPGEVDKLVTRAEQTLEKGNVRFGQVLDGLLNGHNINAENGKTGNAEAEAAVEGISNELRANLEAIRELIGDKTLNEMDSAELANVAKAMKGIQKAVQNSRKVILKGETHDLLDDKDAVMEGLSTQKGLNPSNVNGKDSGLKSILRGLRTITTTFDIRLQTPETLFKMLGNFDSENPMVRCYESLREGVRKMTELTQQAAGYFEEFSGDLEVMKRRNEAVTLDCFTAKGQPVTMTRGSMWSLYMMMKDEDARRHIVQGGGVFANAIDYAGKRNNFGWGNSRQTAYGNNQRYSDHKAEVKTMKENIAELKAANDEAGVKRAEAELAAFEERFNAEMEAFETARIEEINKAIEANMTDADRRICDAARKVFDFYAEKIKQTQDETMGFSGDMLENYFPIQVAQKNIETMTDMARDVDLNSWGSLKKRTGSDKPVRVYDIFDTVATYSRKASAYCGVMPEVSEVRKLLNLYDYRAGQEHASAIGDEIADKYGNAVWDYLGKLMNDLSGGNISDGSIFDSMSGNLAGGVLSANPTVAVGQHASYWAAQSVIGAKYLSRAIGQNLTRSKADRAARNELINKWSSYLWDRGKTGTGFSTSDTKAAEKLANRAAWLMNWITEADRATVGGLWDAAELMVQDKYPKLEVGSDAYYEKVARTWERALESTQPMYDTLSRTDVARSNNRIEKALTRYTTVRLQNWNQMRRGFLEVKARTEALNAARKTEGADTKKAETELKEAQATLAKSVWGVTVSNVLYGTVKSAMQIALGRGKKFKDDEDEEYTLASIASGVGWTVAEAVAGSIPGGSIAVSLLESVITGSSMQNNFSVPAFDAITTIVEETANTITGVAGIWTGKDKAAVKALKSLHAALTNVAQLNGVPMGNIEKLIASVANYGLMVRELMGGDLTTEFYDADFSVDNLIGTIGGRYSDLNDWLDSLYVQRSDSTEMKRYIEAVQSGDMEKAQALWDKLVEKDLNVAGTDSPESILNAVLKKEYMDPKSGLSSEEFIDALVGLSNGAFTEEEAAAEISEMDFQKKYGISSDDLKDQYISEGMLPDGTELTGGDIRRMLEESGMEVQEAVDTAMYWQYLKSRKGTELSGASLSDYQALVNWELSESELKTVLKDRAEYKSLNVTTKLTDERDYAEIDSFMKNKYSKYTDNIRQYMGSSFMNDLYEAAKVGIKSEEYYDWYEKYRALKDNKSISASTAAYEFATMVENKYGVGSEKAKLLRSQMEYMQMIGANTETYDKLTAGGIPVDIVNQFLDHRNGMDKYTTNATRAQSIIESGVPEEYWEQMWNMLRPKNSKTSWQKGISAYNKAKAKGEL